jgi:Ca-activated chloride channel homolog
MSFLAPAALGLSLLALPIILLYMLRLRRREQPVSSIYLWRELVRDQAANTPWQRLKRNLLMFLQLLLLAAIVIALARPYLRLPGLADGRTIILLDASASMQSHDMGNGLTRFESALAEIEQLIALGGGSVSLIKVAQTPTVLAAATTDRPLLRRMLQSVTVENHTADWPAAFALAAASAQGTREVKFVIVSDGKLPDSLPPLPGSVDFISVGEATENLALAALATRRSPDGDVLLAGVTNNGRQSQDTLLTLYLDGVLFDSRRLSIAPDERFNIEWSIPTNTGSLIEARLIPDEGSDFLSLDNQAWAVLGERASREVLLVTEGNLFLERFFGVLSDVRVQRATPDSGGTILNEIASSGNPYDLIVFDSVPLPSILPDANLLVINPNPDSGTPASTSSNSSGEFSLQVTGTFTDTANTRINSDPLLENVDWGLVNIAQGQIIEATGLAPLVEAGGGPLLLAGESNGRRMMVIPFDLRESDLPLQVAFPIMMANITEWLTPSRVLTSTALLRPADSVLLTPDSRAEAIVIEKPDGSQWENRLDPTTRNVLFTDTNAPGVYQISHLDRSGNVIRVDSFAINFMNSEESRIQPSDTILIGQSEILAESALSTGRREIWPWFLVVGLAVMVFEWWINYSRPRQQPIYKT